MSSKLDRVRGRVPGPRTTELAGELRRRESRNVTYLADDFPVFWDSARGATVTDVDGNRYIDLTAAFGVANVGHANRHVAKRVRQQARRLPHGMGDVHPTALRVELLERLSQILPSELTKTFLATTGSEAVEAALKTAVLATGKTHFASYRGAYHGLSIGALAVGGIPRFRAPFASAIGAEPLLLEFPRRGVAEARDAADQAATLLRAHPEIAALVIEPIQGRGGCIVPPDGYLAAMRTVCDELGILLIVDEIFTGFGRTGSWFAIEREGIVPDVICIGKAMGSGFPISATIGKSSVMDAWPQSAGEALHTSTYLGNPIGCAAAVATIDELTRRKLPQRACELGAYISARLNAIRRDTLIVDVRGCGLCWGIQLRDAGLATAVVTRALAKGVIVLQSGIAGEVVSISPPLVVAERQLDRALDILESTLASVATSVSA